MRSEDCGGSPWVSYIGKQCILHNALIRFLLPRIHCCLQGTSTHCVPPVRVHSLRVNSQCGRVEWGWWLACSRSNEKHWVHIQINRLHIPSFYLFLFHHYGQPKAFAAEFASCLPLSHFVQGSINNWVRWRHSQSSSQTRGKHACFRQQVAVRCHCTRR